MALALFRSIRSELSDYPLKTQSIWKDKWEDMIDEFWPSTPQKVLGLHMMICRCSTMVGSATPGIKFIMNTYKHWQLTTDYENGSDAFNVIRIWGRVYMPPVYEEDSMIWMIYRFTMKRRKRQKDIILLKVVFIHLSDLYDWEFTVDSETEKSLEKSVPIYQPGGGFLWNSIL